MVMDRPFLDWKRRREVVWKCGGEASPLPLPHFASTLLFLFQSRKAAGGRAKASKPANLLPGATSSLGGGSPEDSAAARGPFPSVLVGKPTRCSMGTCKAVGAGGQGGDALEPPGTRTVWCVDSRSLRVQQPCAGLAQAVLWAHGCACCTPVKPWQRLVGAGHCCGRSRGMPGWGV